jgi:signal transduction histidine kinase
VLIGTAGLRWASWVWLTAVTVVNLHRLHHPAVAVVAIIATGTMTVVAHLALQGSHWQRALRPGLVGAEVAVAIGVVVADGWVEQGRLTGQTLAGSWPIPAILVAALASGLAGGLGVGILLSAARAVAVAVSGTSPGQAGRASLAVVSTAVSWIVFGAVSGAIIRLVRRTQRQLAEAEVREQIARDLHDGVLQTLAMIERRSPSADIAQLARDQERDLRAYLFGDYQEQGGLAADLRATAARFERAWPGTVVTVSVSEDIPSLGPERVEAVAGAVAEALTNAAKHARASEVTVCAESTVDRLDLSIRDDGIGGADVQNGSGLIGLKDRAEALGGRIKIKSPPGDGTSLTVTIPLDSG